MSSSDGASTSGRGASAAASAAGGARVHPIVEYGCSAGFFGVVGTIAVGVFGTLTGRQRLYDSMLRARIVMLGGALGLYVAGTGFVPVPPPLVAAFGPPTRKQLQ